MRNSVKRPHTKRPIITPAEKRKQHALRLKPISATGHSIAHPNRPHRKFKIIHAHYMRMTAINRKKSRIIAALRIRTTIPKRKYGKLMRTFGMILIRHEETKTPPIAMTGPKRPYNIRCIPFSRPKWTQRRVPIVLFVEGTDLKRGGKYQKFSEHPSSLLQIRVFRNLKAHSRGFAPYARSRERGPCRR